MRELIFSLLYSLSRGFRYRARLHLEIVALRHQLAVLKRKVPTRPKLKLADSWLWVVLSLCCAKILRAHSAKSRSDATSCTVAFLTRPDQMQLITKERAIS